MSTMTWIRLELPDLLHRRLKAEAAMAGMTLRDYLLKVLGEAIETEASEDQK